MFVLIPVIGPMIAGVGAILGIAVMLKGQIFIVGPPHLPLPHGVSLYLLGALIIALSF